MKTIETEAAVALVREASKLSAAQCRELANARLRELVSYARANSPFFEQLYGNVGDDFTLSDLPSTNKAQLSENFNDWVTDREVDISSLRQHMEVCKKAERPTPYLNKYSYVSTSGTTGTPFTILRDDYHNKIHGALIAERLSNAVGADALSPAKNKIASIIVTNPSVSSYGSFLRAKNAVPQFSDNMLAISTAQSIKSMVSTLNAYKPTFLTGYPSVIDMLADEQTSGRLKLDLIGIASSAEHLSYKAYERIRSAFNCPLLNNYCMTEGGEVAFSNGLCADLHINSDWVIVEPIDENGKPSEEGVYSHSLLITDLSNYICPIIRYRVNDQVMIRDSASCTCGSKLPILSIKGRSTPPIKLCGNAIPAVAFMSVLEKTKDVLNYQVARVTDDTLEIRLYTKSPSAFKQVRPQVEKLIYDMLEEMDCREAKLRVVDKMPVIDPVSGKLKHIVDEVAQ